MSEERQQVEIGDGGLLREGFFGSEEVGRLRKNEIGSTSSGIICHLFWKEFSMRHTNRFLIVVSLVLFFLATGIFAQPPLVSRAELGQAIAVQKRHTRALMADPEVVGTGVGVGANGQAVIRVFVKRGQLSGLQGTLDGIPVVTHVTGEIIALKGKPPPKDSQEDVDPTARFDRPVPIGVSTGHPDITAGTIGCRVTDGPNVYALSNNHVYAHENLASIGDAVIQPGTYDGGGDTGADDIGTLFDFEPIKFDGSDNTIDAAIAVSSTSLLGNATPGDGYGTPKSTTMAAIVNKKGSSGKWGGGDVVGTFRIPNPLPVRLSI